MLESGRVVAKTAPGLWYDTFIWERGAPVADKATVRPSHILGWHIYVFLVQSRAKASLVFENPKYPVPAL